MKSLRGLSLTPFCCCRTLSLPTVTCALPTHLYGELCSTAEGLEYFKSTGILEGVFLCGVGGWSTGPGGGGVPCWAGTSPPQGCIRRKGTSEAAPEAIR